MVHLRFPVRVVVATCEEIHVAVVVDGPDDTVEVNDAVEEIPGDVPLHGAEEGIDRHHVASGWPLHIDEILIAPERELAERELGVAMCVGLAGDDVGVHEYGHAGGRTPDNCCADVTVSGRFRPIDTESPRPRSSAGGSPMVCLPGIDMPNWRAGGPCALGGRRCAPYAAPMARDRVTRNPRSMPVVARRARGDGASPRPRHP